MELVDHLPYPVEEHKVRLLVGDPVAEAAEWIIRYAESLGRYDDYDGIHRTVSAKELVETAMTHVEAQNYWDADYIEKGDLLEGVSTDPTFWTKLSILKQIEIPHNKRNNFFSCSC